MIWFIYDEIWSRAEKFWQLLFSKLWRDVDEVLSWKWKRARLRYYDDGEISMYGWMKWNEMNISSVSWDKDEIQEL